MTLDKTVLLPEGLEAFGAQAEALRIAERWLIKQGWKFTPAEVGTRAKEILAALEAGQ